MTCIHKQWKKYNYIVMYYEMENKQQIKKLSINLNSPISPRSLEITGMVIGIIGESWTFDGNHQKMFECFGRQSIT